MKKIDVITTYVKANSGFWKPKSWFGYLLCSLMFLILLSVFILLFCLPDEREYEPEVPEQEVIEEPQQNQDTPIPGTGDVQILLKWYDENDLDISCVDPNNEKIYYNHLVSASGGRLDIDMNREKPYRLTPIENIFWPDGGAPKGTYKVYLTYYSKHSETKIMSNYDIFVKCNGITNQYSGIIGPDQKGVHICTFTVN